MYPQIVGSILYGPQHKVIPYFRKLPLLGLGLGLGFGGRFGGLGLVGLGLKALGLGLRLRGLGDLCESLLFL